MEFEAETWWFWSTHEYYKTTKFQLLQTPSLSAPTVVGYFRISGTAALIKEINGQGPFPYDVRNERGWGGLANADTC